jgi:hypothetical protein
VNIEMSEVTLQHKEDWRGYRTLFICGASFLISIVGGLTYCTSQSLTIIKTQAESANADEQIERAKEALKAAYELPPNEVHAELVAKYASKLSNAYKTKAGGRGSRAVLTTGFNLSNNCECDNCEILRKVAQESLDARAKSD